MRKLFELARIIGIDYGSKRVGMAVTDPLQIISSSLCTLSNESFLAFLTNYILSEEVEAIVIGEPFYPDGKPAQTHGDIMQIGKKIQQLFPSIPVFLQDERFSSVEAKDTILASGIGKKKRRDKGMVDRVAAAIILDAFMERKRNVFSNNKPIPAFL
ncbi:MAG: Holliday junction resolvase RuvX [Saprospiraceae bacterium]|nr:Holliday junction resolvase RuvX [Saprospiraceae bacterium]MDP4700541.1 Holliday junction resolvase RuvX [Saprospiraceae bacterium]MDP4814372.1 Holliday junction resolvase RuvX [Saprospiraceae bacterium]MDP4916072.1 Holliday junction resolvase RuvX [Saprospiraceae bacterium]MDP5046768.1 Holliday junction resolvase RuvX [Saprospiraceae bacterium]